MFCAAVMVVGVSRDPTLIRMLRYAHTLLSFLVYSLIRPFLSTLSSSLAHHFSLFLDDQRCTPLRLQPFPTSLPCYCLINVSKQGALSPADPN